jgi:hypothetical protein
MSQSVLQERATSALLMVGGPALIGVCAGSPLGVAAALRQGAAVPAVVLGISAMMIPALYIGASFVGAAPSARRMWRATTGTLRDIGSVSLGLAPALAVLIATAQDPSVATAFGALTMAAAAVLGLRALYLRLFAGQRRGLWALPLYTIWALVSLGIGWRTINLALEVQP